MNSKLYTALTVALLAVSFVAATQTSKLSVVTEQLKQAERDRDDALAMLNTLSQSIAHDPLLKLRRAAND